MTKVSNHFYKKNLTCKKHGMTIHVRARAKIKGNYRWRCRECMRFHSRERRRRIKRELVEARGGACERCGYNKCFGVLHFHHRDKSKKKIHVSARKLEVALKEAEKCDLLCANCHYEEEYEYEQTIS